VSQACRPCRVRANRRRSAALNLDQFATPFARTVRASGTHGRLSDERRSRAWRHGVSHRIGEFEAVAEARGSFRLILQRRPPQQQVVDDGALLELEFRR
jgi:hypothetical protein